MANEFKHVTVGTEITQAEYESITGHAFDSQARGDLAYASSSSQLSRLAIGGAGAVLTSDGTDPVWDTTWSPTGHLIPASDDSYDLGSASAAWQDLFLEGDITLTDAGTLATSAGALTVTSAAAATWSTSAGALTLNGTGGVNLQEGGSTIISISDARALATTNTASVDLDATGAIQVNSSGGALSIGNDNVDQTINIATAGTRTLNIGIGDGTDITTTVVKGTLSVGVDDAGYDVVFYGDTASANMTWDTSVDDLILNGAARIVVPDGQLVLGSTAVGSTAAELNLLDGSAKSTSSITLADADAFIVIDGNDAKQIPASDLSAYILAEGSMNSFQLEDDSGDEVTINNANEVKFIGSGITTNWTDTDNGTDGDPYDMTFTVDAAQTGITSLLATDIKIGEDDQTKIDFETADEIHFYAANVEQVYLADNIFGPQSDSDVDLGTTGVRWKDAFVDSLTVTDNVIVSGNLTVNGTTTTVDTATLAVVDPIVHLQTASDGGALGSDTNKDVGIAMQYHTGSAAKQAFLGIDDSDSYKLMFIPDASLSSEVVSGSVGTIKANLEGDVTGNVTGNTSGTAATVTTAAQGNITSLGTLTTLTVDNVIVNGTTIGHTSDTDLLTLTSANLAVAGDIEVSGSVEVATIDYTDGDLAMTIADGGGVTFAQDITLSADKSLTLPHASHIAFTDVIADNSIDDHDAQGVIFTFNAGATVTPFSPVYLAEDNLVEEANASAIATMPCIGVSINTSDVTVGNPIEVMVMGLIRDDDFNFGTHGGAVYVSTTVGTMTSTAPSGEDNVVQVIGHSIEDDALFVQPCLTTIEHTG